MPPLASFKHNLSHNTTIIQSKSKNERVERGERERKQASGDKRKAFTIKTCCSWVLFFCLIYFSIKPFFFCFFFVLFCFVFVFSQASSRVHIIGVFQCHVLFVVLCCLLFCFDLKGPRTPVAIHYSQSNIESFCPFVFLFCYRSESLSRLVGSSKLVPITAVWLSTLVL